MKFSSTITNMRFKIFIFSFFTLSIIFANPFAQALNIPLHKKGKWQILTYSSLPANKIDFSNQGLSIQVDGSASPLIYPLTSNPLKINKISVEGSIDKLLNIKSGGVQGEKGFDDFNLRFGLVLLGPNRLNWLQKKLAPSWVLKMFNLAPKNQGIDHIHFLNAVQSSSLLNHFRTHDLSDYIKERYAWLMNKPGSFSYTYKFDKPQFTGALWISVDGDDTKSSFNLKIQKITLE